VCKLPSAGDQHCRGQFRVSEPDGFDSFFLAGFECSSHVRADGRRLDLLASTRHDRLAARDYRAVREYGLNSVRDGIRWHLVERVPKRYDWSSWIPMLRAAQASGVQVIWDLCHYGWPEHLDIWSAAFVEHFACYARAVARLIRDESDRIPWYCPVNEMSFWAWAGGQAATMSPCAHDRADELKMQLVRAYIAALEAIREVDRRSRFIVSEPLIHVVGDEHDPQIHQAAEEYRLSQFQAQDMLAGRLQPQLGGRADYLDVIGLNFYPHNQWSYTGNTIPMGHYAYRPLRSMLGEVFRRYQRPLMISETGAEGYAAPYWLHHVCGEVAQAAASGIPLLGVCLYPVLDYPGWDNERLCAVGLLSEADNSGVRTVNVELLNELRRQQELRGAVRVHPRQPLARA
jgi:beta-glucosidase/6-phospho-beta-glucosidase/beta-galactosidase